MTQHSKKACQAQDPTTCRYHGTNKNQIKQLVANLENVFTRKSKLQPLTPSELIANAQTNPLEFTGKKPVWWDETVEAAQNHPLVKNTPKLLDIVNTPMGDAAILWSDFSQRKQDIPSYTERGFQIRRISLVDIKTRKSLGHATISSITKESFEQSFGKDEYAYCRHHYAKTGRKLLPDDVPENLTSEEAFLVKRKTLVEMYRAFSEYPDGLENVSDFSLADISEDPKEVDKQFKILNAKLKEEYVELAKAHKTPYITYSEVKPALKGKGYGSQMYVYAARVLGEQNTMLRASSLQSDSAITVWKNFAKTMPKHVSYVKIRGQEGIESFPTLDFRTK